MPRPQCYRRVNAPPACVIFKPAGVPARCLQEIVLTLDEFEALRLADHNGLYHEDAAAVMNISRPTFGRIIDKARKKTAEALIMGKALRIEGGAIRFAKADLFQCADCRHPWTLSPTDGRPRECPQCKSRNLQQMLENNNNLGNPAHKRRCGCGFASSTDDKDNTKGT